MSKLVIYTKDAPEPVGVYSQGIMEGHTLYVSGQVPIDPTSGTLIEGDFKESARQVLKNVRAIVEAAGLSLDDIVKTTVFLRDMEDFATLNEVYSEFFITAPPARSVVQAGRLPKDFPLEIEAIAYSPEKV